MLRRLSARAKKVLLAAFTLFMSFSVLCVALYAGFSVAWFVDNDRVNVQGLSIKVDGQHGASLKNYAIYKRDGTGASRVASSDDETPVNVQMTEFDPIFVDRNVNTPIVVRLELEDIPAGNPTIVISTSCVAPLFNKDGKIDTNISNVVGVRAAQIPSPSGSGQVDLNTIADTDANADDIYSGVVDYFSDKTVTAFTTVSGSAVSKNTALTILISDYTVKTDRTAVLYIELDYVSTLVFAFVDSHGIEITGETKATGDMIMFDYDLNAFAVNYQ